MSSENCTKNLYLTQPKITEMHYSDLMDICLQRLQLYEILRDATNCYIPLSFLWRKLVILMVKRNKLCIFQCLLDERCEYFNEDLISHYLLRFLYCGNFDDRQFFVQRELEIVALRSKNFNYNLKKSCLDKNLLAQDIGLTIDEANNMDFYIVDFYRVPTLITEKRCVLRLGKAHFAAKDLPYFLMDFLKPKYLKYLYDAQQIKTDERLKNLIENLPTIRKNQNKALSTTNLNLLINDGIEELTKNFPLCMKNIHEHLKKNHHLKYHMKLQYGIFLKNLGLPYEEVLNYFRKYYTKKFPEKIYRKKHEYLFKHIFGKVGRTHNYMPSTCKDIIEVNVGPMENHGCPFKHFDSGILENFLVNEKVRMSVIQEIKELKMEKKYQVACQKYCNGDLPISPVNYFQNNCNNSIDIEDLFC